MCGISPNNVDHELDLESHNDKQIGVSVEELQNGGDDLGMLLKKNFMMLRILTQCPLKMNHIMLESLENHG